jgi:hypothetical protein
LACFWSPPKILAIPKSETLGFIWWSTKFCWLWSCLCELFLVDCPRVDRPGL